MGCQTVDLRHDSRIKKIEDALKEAESLIKEIQNYINLHKEEYKTLSGRVDKLELNQIEQFSKLTTELDALRADLDSFDSEWTGEQGYRKKVDKLEQWVEEHKVQFNEFKQSTQTNFDKLTLSHKELLADLTVKYNEYKQFENSISNKINDFKSEYDLDLRDVNNKLDSLQTKVQDLGLGIQNNIQALEGKINTQGNKIEELNNLILKTQVDLLDKVNTVKETFLIELHSLDKNYNDGLTSLREQFANILPITTDVSLLKSNLQTLSDDLNKNFLEHKDFINSLNSLKDKFDCFSGKMEEKFDGYLSLIKNLYSEYEIKYTTLLDSLKSEINNKIEIITNNFNTLKDSVNGNTTSINSLLTKTSNLEEKIKELDNAINEVKDSLLQSVNEKIAKLEATVDTIKEQVKRNISSVFVYMGSLSTVEELPTEGNEIGFTYNIISGEDAGYNFTWNGKEWDRLAGTIDLTPYATIESLNREIGSLKSTLTSLIDSKVKLVKDDLNDYKSQADGELAVHEREINQNTHDISVLEENYDSLESTMLHHISDLAEDSTKHKSSIESLTNLLSNLSEKVDSVEAESNNKFDSLEEGVKANKTSISSLDEKVTTVSDKVSTIESDLETIENTVNTLNSTVNTFDERVSTNSDSINDIGEQVTTISGKVDSNVSSITELTSKVSEIETNVSEIETNVSEIETNVSENSNSIDEVKANVETNTNAISSVESRVEEIEEFIKQVPDSSTYASLTDKVNTNTGNIETNLNIINSLKDQVKLLETKLTEDLESLKSELDTKYAPLEHTHELTEIETLVEILNKIDTKIVPLSWGGDKMD